MPRVAGRFCGYGRRRGLIAKTARIAIPVASTMSSAVAMWKPAVRVTLGDKIRPLLRVPYGASESRPSSILVELKALTIGGAQCDINAT